MWPAEKAVSAIYRGGVETPIQRADRLARVQNNLRLKLAEKEKELERFDAVKDMNHNLLLRLRNLESIISRLQKKLNECENNPAV